MGILSKLRIAHQKGWDLLRGPLFWWFVPAFVLNALIVLLVVYAVDHFADWIYEEVVIWRSPNEPVKEFFLEWSPIRSLVKFLVIVQAVKYIALIVMGPVYALVSEHVETKLTGVKAPFSLRRFLNDVVRGIRSAMLLATIEYGLYGLIFVLTMFYPLGGVVALIPAWMIGVWAFGAAAMDYVWERDGLGAKQALMATLKRPMMAFGIGLPFAIWMSIPIPLISTVAGPLIGGMGAAAMASVLLKDPELQR